MCSFVSNFHTVPDDELDLAVNLAVRFTARLVGPRGFQEELEALQPDTVRALRSWRRWAVQSHYWGALWRGVISGYPTLWGATKQDVAMVLGHLSEEERERVEALRGKFHLSRFSSAELQKIYRSLERYCWVLFNQRLRVLKFFSAYDALFHAEDVVTDLMEAGMLSVWVCEETGLGLAHAINYAKKSAKNHALFLLEKHTAAKRNRFMPDGNGKYTPRHVDYDSLFDEPSQESKPDDLFSAIRVQLGPQYEQYARAVLGYDPDFDDWVMSHHINNKTCYVRKRSRKEFPSQTKTVSKLAERWVGLPRRATECLKRDLAPLLIERLQS